MQAYPTPTRRFVNSLNDLSLAACWAEPSLLQRRLRRRLRPESLLKKDHVAARMITFDYQLYLYYITLTNWFRNITALRPREKGR
jgi:hypothetical protein